MPRERIDARIGPLKFNPDFPDPYVDIDREMRTAEHETVNDEFVVQVLGRKPDKINVEGVLYDHQVGKANELLEAGEITVRTNEWRGKAVATSVDTDFRREADPNSGWWAYDVTIDLVEVERYSSEVRSGPESEEIPREPRVSGGHRV